MDYELDIVLRFAFPTRDWRISPVVDVRPVEMTNTSQGDLETIENFRYAVPARLADLDRDVEVAIVGSVLR